MPYSHHQSQTLAGDAGPLTGGGGLGASKIGKMQDKGKLGKCHVYSGNADASDCGSGAWSTAFLLRQHVEYTINK